MHLKNLKMKSYTSLIAKLVSGLSVLALVSSSPAADEAGFDRSGHWEIGLPGKFWFGNDIIKDAIGTGFMGGYNFNEHWNLNLEAYCGIHLDTEVDGIDGKGTIYTGILNVEYYVKPGRFSPYLTASGGIFNYDTKETFHGPSRFSVATTGMSYGGGAGVRYAIDEHWFLKGSFHVFAATCNGVGVMYGPEVTIGFQF
jgi:opacity protein-like surface antigen